MLIYDIISIINSFKYDTAAGLDKVTVKILKHIGKFIVYYYYYYRMIFSKHNNSII